MFAIIETGGKQYQVETERYLEVELLDAKVDETVTFDKVVMVVDGENSKVGQPYVDGIVVTAKVMKHDKSKKVIVYKQHRKKGYRKKQGHRQNFTRIMIEDITGSKPKAKKAEAAVTQETKVTPKAAPVAEKTTAATKKTETVTKKAAPAAKKTATATKKTAPAAKKPATTAKKAVPAKKTTKKTEK